MIAKRFLNIIFSIMLSACCSLAAVTQAPNAAAMPDLNVSPDQMQKMEVMMNEMQNFYENLSPEEKNEFEAALAKEVADEQKKLEAMAPAAQKQYIETAFKAFDDISIDELIEQLGDAEASGQQNAAEDKPSDKAAASKKAENEKSENKKKIKDTLDLINNIIKVLNNLSTKLNSIKPSAQDLVDKWIKKGSIQKWIGEKSSWNLFNKDLQTMKQRLEKLKQADPKTGQYYYLNDIKIIEKLYGQLEMLYSKIKKYESSIEINAAGQMKNEAAKSALIGLINYLADTTKTIIKNADEIISKFEKTGATKIKSEEEKRAAAAKTSRKPRAGETKSAGRAERYDADTYQYSPYAVDSAPSYYGPTYSSSSYGSGDRPDSSFGGSSSGSPAGSSSAGSSSAGSSSADGSSAGRSGGSSSAGTALADSGDATKKKDLLISDDKTKALEASGPQGTTRPEATKQVETDAAKKKNKEIRAKHPKVDKLLKKATFDLSEFKDSFEILKGDKNWTGINGYLQGTEINKPFEDKLADVSSKLNKAESSASDFKDGLNEKSVDATAKKYFADKARKAIEDCKETETEISKKVTLIKGSVSFVKQANTGTYNKILSLEKAFSEIKALLS